MFNFSIPSATYLLCLVIKAGDSQSGLLESGPFPAIEGFGSALTTCLALFSASVQKTALPTM